MSIIIQKFGGSSLTSEACREQAVHHILKQKANGKKVVVVVSAMGRKGDPYATDTLLKLLDYQNGMYIENREKDLLLHCGEIISATVLANMLVKHQQRAIVLTGSQAGIITTDEYTDAQIIEIKTERILRELYDNKVVIVTGFQGISRSGEITTLGRGGSDTTATALGAALNAECCDIFTDVDGVMTADPSIVPDARKLQTITYHQICNLAYQGAKVIHPRAVEVAMQKKMPIHIRSTFHDENGTLVTDEIAAGSQLEQTNKFEHILTGITQMPRLTQIQIYAGEGQYDLQMKVFGIMAENHISVDFINVNMNSVAYTVSDEDSQLALAVLREAGIEPVVEHHCAKISCIGSLMKGVPGVMAKIIKTLTIENIRILQSADSHTTIWVLVKDQDMEKGVRALHKAFYL